MPDITMWKGRKKWTWPVGLAPSVYNRIRKWFKQYDNTGQIHKSRRIPHQRHGVDVPETQVIMRVHTLAFTYNELKWLRDMIHLEDDKTTQAIIFTKAMEKLQNAQNRGTVGAGVALAQEYALTKDEVGWIMTLLECIGIYPKQTPSERKLEQEAIEKGDW